MKNKKLMTYEEFWEYLSACYTKINLANYHHKFEKDSYLIATDRIFLDALHTLIDGYTLNDNGEEIIELKLDPRIKSEIKTKKAGFEFMRSALTHKFIRLGQGCVSDYFHLLKLYLINRGLIKAPRHFNKILVNKDYIDKMLWINKRVDEIIYELFLKKNKLNVKNLFSAKVLSSKTGKGRKKRDPKFIPGYICKAVKSIIEKNKSVNQTQLYSKVAPSTFERSWKIFKYPALIQYFIDLSLDKSQKDENRVKKIIYPKKNQISSLLNQKGNQFRVLIKLSDKQKKKLKIIWGFKKVPDQVEIIGFIRD